MKTQISIWSHRKKRFHKRRETGSDVGRKMNDGGGQGERHEEIERYDETEMIEGMRGRDEEKKGLRVNRENG